MRPLRTILPLALLLAGCGEPPAPGTDGIAFLHLADARLAAPEPAGAANRASFASALDRMRAGPGNRLPPSLLIVTGELSGAPAGATTRDTSTSTARDTAARGAGTTAAAAGTDTTRTGTTGAGRTGTNTTGAGATPATVDSAAELVARVLATAPAAAIYLALAPADTGLAERLRTRAAPGTAVHDLTACYAGRGAATCIADVDEPYRLVGFAPGDTLNRNIQRLEVLVADARRAGRQVVIVASSVPAIPAADTTAARIWGDILGRSEVLGVVTGGTAGADEHGKVRRGGALSPPAAGAKRVVAEGRTKASGLEYTQLAYRAAFGGPGQAPPRGTPDSWFVTPFMWLWGLAPGAPDLPKFVIVAIALLAAALTVAALWRLEGDGPTPAAAPPPPAAAGAAGVSGAAGAAGATGAAGERTARPVYPTDAFNNNFSRTILSGLAGLLVLSFLQISWQNLFADANPFYIAWFIALFVVLLWIYALARGLVEALRSRIANPYVAPRFTPTPGTGKRRQWGAYQRYWVRRIFRWLVSYRATLLVFLDTVMGVVLGRNQMRSGVWERTIVDLHWSLHRVMEEVRRDLASALNAKADELAENSDAPVGNDPAAPDTVEPADARPARSDLKRVRVSISLLAQDGLSAYYVIADETALTVHFPQNSVAWVALATGQARWWKKSYPKEKIHIFDNTSGILPVAARGPLPLTEYFEERAGADYEAFLALPVPRRRGGAREEHRRGAIHISFTYERDFDRIFGRLWDEPESAALEPPATPVQGQPAPATPEPLLFIYDKAPQVFDLSDPELGRILRLAADVLGNAIERFDDDVFETYIRPCRGR